MGGVLGSKLRIDYGGTTDRSGLILMCCGRGQKRSGRAKGVEDAQLVEEEDRKKREGKRGVQKRPLCRQCETKEAKAANDNRAAEVA